MAPVEQETGTLLGVNGLASKPMSEVGLVVAVVTVDELVVVDETVDGDVEADDAAAAAAAAADPCSSCLSNAFWGNKKNY